VKQLDLWVRTQAGPFDDMSLKTGLACPVDEDHTRQEAKEDADINVLLKRHGGIPPSKVPSFGEVDFDVDLRGALERTRAAEVAFEALPLSDAIRREYPDWHSFAAAVARGDVSFRAVEAPAGGSGGESTDRPSPEGAAGS